LTVCWVTTAGPAPPDDADIALGDVGIALDDVDIDFDDVDVDLEMGSPAPRNNSPALGDDQPAHWRRIDIAALVARENDDEDIGKHAHIFIVNC
jgi:hypothetical protein